MKARVRILSYFSLPTDLAAAMEHWPEYIDGEGYSVLLESKSTGETVQVDLVDADSDEPGVHVTSSDAGALFARVLGTVTYLLAAHSDYLMVYRRHDESA